MPGWVEILAGLIIVFAVLYDLFHSVVLPRPAVNKFALVRYLFRAVWTGWRWVGFRTSRVARREAWLAAFGPIGVLLDAATLIMSTIEEESEGPARLMFTIGNHLVEDLAWYFRLESSPEPYVEREEFDQAVARLAKAGHRCRQNAVAWKEFASLRAKYAFPLNQMAKRLAIVPAQWIGDRSYAPTGSARASAPPEAVRSSGKKFRE